MLTKNGRLFISAALKGGRFNDIEKGRVIAQDGIAVKTAYNTYLYEIFKYVTNEYSMLPSSKKFFAYTTINGGSSTSNGIGVCLSSDNTPEKLDDYYIEDCGLTCESISTNKEHSTQYCYSISTLASNNTSENITVKTVGIYASLGNGSENVLLYKEVLDEPVTIKPDESYMFSITIK